MSSTGTSDASQTSPARTRDASAKPGRQDSEQERVDRTLKVVWWNNEKFIEALQLSTQQRSDLDELFRKSRDTMASAVNDRHGLRDQFSSAIRDGNWERAEVLAQELADSEAVSYKANMDFVVQGLRKLNGKQRRKLSERYPGIAARPWIVIRQMRATEERPSAADAERSE